MERFQAAAIIAELADRLRANGSWCGETHLQKAAYFLQEVLGVPLGMGYILYMHGPYSFNLTERLIGMRADYLFEKRYVKDGYGAQLRATKESRALRMRYPKTLARYAPRIEFVAAAFGNKGVADLEKLATALWVTRELGDTAGVEDRADRLHELKPHIAVPDARAAIEEFDALAIRAREVVAEETTTA